MKKMRLDPARFPSTPEELAAALIGQWPPQPQPPIFEDDEMSPEQAMQTAEIIRQRTEQQREEFLASLSDPKPPPDPAPPTDRQDNGRFASGNRGGCGNPFARQVAAFRACLINSVTQEDMQAIVWKLVDRARFGNLRAIKLLFSYLLGTPKPVVEPDELDLHEMHLAHQTALAEKALKEAAPSANDAPAPPNGQDGKLATGVPEAPPALPVSAPSPNGTNREPYPSTASEAPSTNRTSDVSEADKLSRPPSTNRPNGDPPAGASKTRPSTNRPNGVRDPATSDDSFPAAPSPAGDASGT
jgi:hypothetical protein